MSSATRLPHVATPANRNYCLQLMRSYDNENFIANLLQPQKSARACHAALRAFNVELANIRSSVSNEDLGRMRIQFFRDGLSAALSSSSSDALPSSPVLDSLAEAASTFPHAGFNRLYALLDAREADLKYPAVASLQALEDFAQATQGSLMAVHAQALGHGSGHSRARSSVAAVEERLVRSAGAAVGLAVILRGVGAHAASRLSYMPRDVAAEMGAGQGELLGGGEAATKVFERVARRAEERLREADEMVRGMASGVRPAFWPLCMAEIYLRRLRAAGFDAFDERLQRRMRATYPLVLQMRLLKCRLVGR